MKLGHWGIKKNKIPLSNEAQTLPQRKARAGTLAGASSGAHPPNEAVDLIEGDSFPR